MEEQAHRALQGGPDRSSARQLPVELEDAALQLRPPGAAPAPRPRGLGRPALLRACAYLEQNIGNSIGLDDVARAACVSRAHFARLFRVSMGTSPMAYLLQLRVERAKTLLVRGEQQVAQIAAQLGFCDQSHFSHAFRRSTGLTPREYARLRG